MAGITRETIISAAVNLFNQNGYHATSMQDIAREVNIKKPSLYHHFQSKEEILLSILETGMVDLVTEVETIARSGQPCEQKLRSAIRAHALTIGANPQAATVFLREDRGLGENYMQRYIAQRDQVEAAFRSIVEQGITEGVFQVPDLSITVQAVLGVVNWMSRWYRPSGRLSAGEIADLFAELLLNGLLAGARNPQDQ
ncbi:MAG: TetR family transcriptional regulator [Anaerolineae bacterium]|nr:TetR family transcriptional regulator [Anaerolineae bacterium]